MSAAARAIAAVLLLCGGLAVAFAQELSLRQPDGKIVTVIDDKGAGGPLLQWIERHNPDGSLDLTFGNSGRATFSLTSADILEPRSLAIDAQGRLILAGAAVGAADRSAPVVSRFLPDGRADPRWGTQGTSRLAAPTQGAAQAVDALAMPDQGMLLLGQLDPAGSPKVVLYRLRFDGTADASFGAGGVLHLAPLDGAQPTSLRLDEDGAVLIASQRARAGGLRLEAHRWLQGQEGLRLVASQDAPADWRGPATLERRDGRWQWADAMVGGVVPLVLVGDAGSTPAAAPGLAALNPFALADASGIHAPLAALGRSVGPGFGWLWIVPAAAALGILMWRRHSTRATDPVAVDRHAVMIEATLADLARLPSAPAEGRPPPTAGVADAAPAPPACRNGLEHPIFGPPDDLKRIKGIGPVLEQRLHGEGIFYLWQIAQWRPEDVAGVGARLGAFKGRIERDRWVAQAIELSS